MIIDQLRLQAFGKFQGRVLHLAPGLNILYGENEAGKSTVQRFLLAMLYGMKKRSQRRDFTEDNGRYRPWVGSDYRGALQYTLASGRSYRVERQFDPRSDEVRVYDTVTGLDLSGQFQQDRRKELNFAEKHWGLSEEAFRATAWVGQLQVSQVDGGRELVARVANLQESGSEELSVGAALAWLDDRVKAIGTERAPTKPYGRLLRSMEESSLALVRAERAQELTQSWDARLMEVKAILGEMEQEVAEAERRWEWAKLAELEARVERYRRSEARLTALQERAAALAPYAGVDISQREPLRRLVDEERGLMSQAALYGSRVGALQGEIAPLEAELAKAMRSTEGKVALRLPIPAWVGLVVAAVGGVGFALRLNAWVAAALGLVGLAFFFLNRRQAADHRYQDLRQQCAMYVRERESLQQAEREIIEQVGTIRRRSAAILNGQTVDGFEEGCLGREALTQVEEEVASFSALLAGEGAHTLADELARLRTQVRGTDPMDGRPAAAWQAEIRRLESRRADLQAEASDLKARIETAQVADVVDLRRILSALQEERSAMEAEVGALELAQTTLEAVRGELHREFAPRLNRALGTYVADLTLGAYQTVRLDESLAMRAITVDDRTVDMASLSGGTIDQFYLGLRLALLDLATEEGEAVPLCLDDPFVQYDDARAEQALLWLQGVSRRRQVVLFTCHQREVRLAGAGAHLINLAEEATRL